MKNRPSTSHNSGYTPLKRRIAANVVWHFDKIYFFCTFCRKEDNKRRIAKSTRHSKIAGDFGEVLVSYWLSRRGFETAIVDHTGIDLISRRPNSEEVLGISVKTRSKILDTKIYALNIKSKDIEKAKRACEAFGCQPYFAIIIDHNGKIRGFLISLNKLLSLYPKPTKVLAFGLSESKIQQYLKEGIEHFELQSANKNW